MIKIFKSVTRRAGIPAFDLPEKYAVTTPQFRELYKQKGVYILYLDKDAKKPLYIGRSKTDLGRTVARHFQKWSAKELKFIERDPKQLDRLFVEVELMPGANDQEIIDKETELIEKFQPSLNIRKNALKQKNPDFYEMTKERRDLLNLRVQEYEAEQAARDQYEIALAEFEQAEAERQAAEQAALEAAEAQERAEQAAKAEQTAKAEREAEKAAEQAEQAEQAAKQAALAAEQARQKAKKRLSKISFTYRKPKDKLK